MIEEEEEISLCLKEHDLVISKKLGSGGSGQCYKVFSLKYKEYFACKIIPVRNEDSGRKPYDNEYKALTSLVHPHIIQVYDYFVTPTKVYLILEFCPNGDLLEYVNKYGPIINAKELYSSLSTILDALIYLEMNNCAHNDIKPSNILIDKYGRLKLADFGLMKYIDEERLLSCDYAGSLAFLAPEIVKKMPYNPIKADVWSFGVTTYFLAIGSFPFDVHSKSNLIISILEGKYELPRYLDMPIKHLIEHCLVVNPNDRLSFQDLKRFIPSTGTTIAIKTNIMLPKLNIKSCHSCDIPKSLMRIKKSTRIRGIVSTSRILPH